MGQYSLVCGDTEVTNGIRLASSKLEASAGRLMPVLVKAIQELAAQVEDLKAQLEAKNAE